MTVNLDATLAALAEPTRRRVVELLRQRPQRAGELASATASSGPAMSRHLRVLRAAGLVNAELVDLDARGRLYRLRPEPFEDLDSWLLKVRGFWDLQLGAFKAHAERRHSRRRGR